MKKKVERFFCDYCGDHHEILDGEAFSIVHKVGSRMDAAGGRESVWLNVDVCEIGICAIVDKLLKLNDNNAKAICDLLNIDPYA